MPPLQFSPVMIPLPFDKAGRIAELRNQLQTETLVPQQVENIEATVKMYETGELPKGLGALSFIQDGKMLPSLKALDTRRPFIMEVRLGRCTRRGLIYNYDAILLTLGTGHRYAGEQLVGHLLSGLMLPAWLGRYLSRGDAQYQNLLFSSGS